jgi:predicted flavoprotein YhiN
VEEILIGFVKLLFLMLGTYIGLYHTNGDQVFLHRGVQPIDLLLENLEQRTDNGHQRACAHRQYRYRNHKDQRQPGIDETTNLSVLSKAQRLDLIKKLKAFPLTFVSLEDIDKGIVTSGGVDVNEVDPKSMESKLCGGLYFIGEVLDVDAFTGGFNLQSALSTGYACAKAIKKA